MDLQNSIPSPSDTLTVKITVRQFVMGLIALLCVVLCVAVLQHTGYALYWNNQWKRPRWASDVCRAHNVDPRGCAIILPVAQDHNISTERVFIDWDLDHPDHWRRLQ